MRSVLSGVKPDARWLFLSFRILSLHFGHTCPVFFAFWGIRYRQTLSGRM